MMITLELFVTNNKKIIMKKIITFSSFALLVFTKINAQTYIPSIDTCNHLLQLAGEWRYTNGNDTIKMYFRYHKYFAQVVTVDYKDELWGWHEYKSGNTVIQSNYQHRNDVLPFNTTITDYDLNSINITLVDCSDTATFLKGYLLDSHHPTSTYRVAATLNPAKNIMTWWHTWVAGSFHNPDKGMTLPREFILYKQ
jgi:hypothetical protein